tara:strand:- start:661 stop:1065 length:405 start_codon:yes stop_codon:yes gene_type:complete
MKLDELEILEDDFDLFVALDEKEKIEFIFDAIKDGIEASVLKQINKMMKPIQKSAPIVHTEDYQVGKYRLCITTTKKQIQLNSNSLRVINKYLSKLINDGLILQRIKMKRSAHDLYKYLRVYNIIGFGGPFSNN